MIEVGILGATGSVGRKLATILIDHPWFKLTAVAASVRSQGKNYGDFVPGYDLTISAPEPTLPCKIVFSALDSDVAGPIEEAFADRGYIVVSNAKNHRMTDNVPLVIPEVNSDHLKLLKGQVGAIITNPNCAAVGLTLALKPLVDSFGVESVHIVTMQAISGAGDAGKKLDIEDNIIPFIPNEEDKIENEPKKILGTLKNGQIEPLNLKISAQANRVPVSDGHTASVSVKLKTTPTPDELIAAWEAFKGLNLPTAPEKPIQYLPGIAPQPRHHRDIDKGMAVTIGGLRPCNLFDYKFTLLSHNTIRGAAGSAILNAELICESLAVDLKQRRILAEF